MATELKQTDGNEDYKASKIKKYVLTSKVNRTRELHIRKSVYIFSPNGSLPVDEYVINSDDFKQQQDDFIVSEVK